MWRSKGLGSSDAAVIMGVSPWKNIHELWEEKTGKVVKDQSNFATERGLLLEPKARAHYELLTDCDMPPLLVQHKDYPFLRASLDGCNLGLRRILEIKCPGKADHDIAKRGEVPKKYFPQLQHQLLVTGFDRVDYFSFDGETGVLVEVYPDEEYLQVLLQAELTFWKQVEDDLPPPVEVKPPKQRRAKNVNR